MRLPGLRWFVLVLVVLAVAAGGAAIWVNALIHRPYQGYAGHEQFVDVPAGSGVEAIGRRLIDAGIVRDRLTFRTAVWMTGAGRRLQAGEYRFDRPVPALEVVRRLERGDAYLHPITFREGLTIREKALVFEARGFGPADAFVEAATRGAPLIEALDPGAPDLEGYLFPDTYALPRGTSADRLVAVMAARFRQAFDEELREAARRRNLSVREVVTLASLIEKETGRPEERPLVSAVFNNRLRLGMAMQCDPTVIYALEREGQYTGRLTRAALAFDSPYNTYRYRGLPPGPIAAPGRASLAAALDPAEADYLYFVSRNDGSHVFSRTLREHNRAVHEYQILYFREKRARERAEAELQ